MSARATYREKEGLLKALSLAGYSFDNIKEVCLAGIRDGIDATPVRAFVSDYNYKVGKKWPDRVAKLHKEIVQLEAKMANPTWKEAVSVACDRKSFLTDFDKVVVDIQSMPADQVAATLRDRKAELEVVIKRLNALTGIDPVEALCKFSHLFAKRVAEKAAKEKVA